MTTGKALNGKPYAGNPHVWFDEVEVALAADGLAYVANPGFSDASAMPLT